MTAHLHACQAAIVDLDGTMVDTLGDFLAALNAMLHDLHLGSVDACFVEQAVGKGSEHLIRRTLEAVQGDPQRYDEAWLRYQHHYAQINGRHATVYPGVVEGLRALRGAGWPLACVTNKPTAFANELLRRKGLGIHFAQVFGGDAFDRMKPDPLPLLQTCRALGVAPGHTLVIGDSSNDARAARAAGCPVVLVTYGYNHGRPIREAEADAYVDRLDAIGLGL